MSRNLATRIAVAAAAIPLILWIGYQGGWWLFGMVSLFALVATVEFLINEGHQPGGFVFWLAMLAVVAVLVAVHLRVETEALRPDVNVPVLVTVVPWLFVLFFMLAGMVFATGRQSPRILFRRYTRLVWGIVYIGLLYPFVYVLGECLARPYVDFPVGGDFLLFLFGVLWVGDTAAMGIGKWIGRHKLAPTVSPNKTVEGFFGGLLGALVIGVVMIFWKFSIMAWYHVLIIALGCSVFGQLGDLVESLWKRSLKIKDSSVIVPGHGGVLDRFDSLLFAAPFMYFYVRFLYW